MSSAKAAIWLDLTASGKEFTNRRNNMGPRIDPVGPLKSQARGLKLHLRYDSSHVSRFPQNHTDIQSGTKVVDTPV